MFKSMASTGMWFTGDLAPPSPAGLGLAPTGARDGGSFLLMTLSGLRLPTALVSTSMLGPLRVSSVGTSVLASVVMRGLLGVGADVSCRKTSIRSFPSALA